jgi:hypothetical protein
MKEHENIYISVPFSLEKYFVDGNYRKVLNTKQNVPLHHYNFFIDKFVDTVRYEIARSAEKSYECLTLKDALQVFMLNSMEELKEFVNREKDHGSENGVEWNVQGDKLQFVTVC